MLGDFAVLNPPVFKEIHQQVLVGLVKRYLIEEPKPMFHPYTVIFNLSCPSSLVCLRDFLEQEDMISFFDSQDIAEFVAF